MEETIRQYNSKCLYFKDRFGNYQPLGKPTEIKCEYDNVFTMIPNLEIEIKAPRNIKQYMLDFSQDEKEKVDKVELPTHYIINKNACILFWQNGEKTVVKRCADDEFNPRLAFLTAFFQHYVDMSKNKANKYLASLRVEVKEVEPTQKPKHMKEKMIFKVGDRVEVVKKDDWSKKGWKGRITKIDMDDMLQIEVKYDNGEKWWINKNQLKLIKEEK